MDARVLHCPNCGGPASPGEASCKYCHAALATVSCPKCFGLMFEAAMYCPSCGARRARTEGGTRTARCPGCRGTMREVQIGDTSLLECERCHAMWVDRETFDAICASTETQAGVLQQYPDPPKPVTAVEIRYRPCLACGKMMNRMNFGKLSGVVVDVCRGHGTFLDAGELHQIVAFIKAGGLERLRQQQLEDMKEEEERLRALARRDQSSSSTSTVSIRFDSWVSTDVQAFINHLIDK
jgi:Zn-finger nucleic acid-binding protein